MRGVARKRSFDRTVVKKCPKCEQQVPYLNIQEEFFNHNMAWCLHQICVYFFLHFQFMLLAGLQLPVTPVRKKSDVRSVSYSASQSKNMQFNVHKKCSIFGLINLMNTQILWKKITTIKFFIFFVRLKVQFFTIRGTVAPRLSTQFFFRLRATDRS